MARIGRVVALTLVAVAAVMAIAGVAGYSLYTSKGPLDAPVLVTVPKGAGPAQIGRTLADAGVVRSAEVFLAGAALDGAATHLKAGEYRFEPGVSTQDVIAMLRRGDVYVRRLTVPEGLTSAQVVKLIEATDGLTGDVAPIPAEGTLLPETYHYSASDTRAELIGRMQAAMTKTLAELWAARAPDLPLTSPEEAVVLASIVEKETGLEAERPRVAAVFLNRLRRGMRLQADPTVVYAVNGADGALGRSLTRNDLNHPSQYNTYVHDGLPPGPIANPGRASLAAVLQPAETDELYFVADGNGGHVFAQTLADHENNVRRWRQIEKERRGGT